MKEAAKGGNWIYVHHKNEHFGHGDDCVMIEFVELYQLYQMDDLDKSILMKSLGSSSRHLHAYIIILITTYIMQNEESVLQKKRNL